MGSVAAASMFKRFVELTPALKDQEYIETIIHNNTKIPDRTDGILHSGESPLKELKKSVIFLDKAKVDYIILACITSYFFINELQKHADAEIIDAIDETAIYIRKNYPDLEYLGLIASTGAIKTEIFHKKFTKYGIKIVTMTDDFQRKYFTEPIYANWGIKAGYVIGQPKNRLLNAIDLLKNSGAEAVIGGCSELPLVFCNEETAIPFIDSIDILLKSTIKKCLSE